jgi:DNA-binding beta-propeller fold protein YncE
MKYIITIILLISFFFGCVESPTNPKSNIGELSEHGAYILCEGLYGQNNSTLSRYDYKSEIAYNNFFKLINGKNIGDTANDIVIKGDTTFIVVSTQNKILMFNTGTGKYYSEIQIEGGKCPRKMAVINDSILLVTDLYCHCFWVINYNRKIILQKVPTGPAPEGIVVTLDYIFVANSGLGDYLSDYAYSGTVSVFDRNTFNFITTFNGLPNVIELKISNKFNKLYARYNHLPKYTDSTGGIAEFDIATLTETRRWIDKAGQMSISEEQEKLFYISENGVKVINLADTNSVPELILIKQRAKDFWYSIAVNKNDLWIGNAKDYQSNGEILIYDLDNPQNPKKYLKVGLNPNTIVFF